MPRLRKNRRIESRWGVKYYTAVKNAVFITSQTLAYLPKPPPLTVKECFPECENLYTCTQCQDSFHFRSSFEDHIARKSWILGYWCHDCFVTTCKHNSMEGELCSGCTQSDNEKRFYLKHQGLRRDQKHGAVRVFYNQCQFFAHLKAHNVNLKAQNVYMGDLMLMPLPTNMNDWSPEIDLICEALMEHTFISKIHIMDWLKDKNVLDNWWKFANLEAEDDNPVAATVKRYKGRFYFKPLEIPIDKLYSNSKLSHPVPNNNNSIDSDVEPSDSVENVDKQTNTSADMSSGSYESFIENEDSPCTANEIAFVDCGVSSRYLEPEIPLVGNKRGISTVATNSLVKPSHSLADKLTNNETRLNPSLPDAVMSYGNIIITPKRNTKELNSDKQSWRNLLDERTKSTISINVFEKSNIDDRADKTFSDDASVTDPLSKTDSDIPDATKVDTRKLKLDKFKPNVHMLTVRKTGQTLMTIKGPKNADIKSIINSGKNIVLVKRPVDKKADSNNKEPAIRLVPEEKLLETNANQENAKFVEAKSESVLKTGGMKYKANFPAIRTYRNEKKYGTRQSYNLPKTKVIPNIQKMVQLKFTNGVPALIPLNSLEIENISSKEKSNSFQGDVAPLTPSPSPSELSSSSSCDVQSKQSSSSVKLPQKIDTICERNIAADDVNNTSESLLLYKGKDQELYLDVKFLKQKPIFTIVDTFSMITRCREEMLNEFFHLSYSELKKRCDHLQEISEEISRVMSFVTESVIKENLKAILILQTVLKHCIEKSVEDSNTDEEDAVSYDWESEYNKRANEKPICKGCNKIRKPKNYIPGFSKPAKNDIYCSCYRHVCHKCDTYQGNSTRFVAHQTFHDKEKPFLCPDCYRKFTTYRSLEVHTWTTCFHTLKKRVLGCKVCEVDGFQDMESVARHFALMHSTSKVACDRCHIVLPSYSKYAKHYKDKHSEAGNAQKQPIRLVLCKLGRCIVRCEDYMSHMEKHSAVQVLIWFKCPFCTFIHVEAQRIMSHLQSTHEARLQELISSRFLHSLLRADNPQLSKFMNANFCENDGTVVPKIVNTRTITSEVFERGADGSEDYMIAPQFPQTDDTLSSFRSSKSWPKILDVKSLASLAMNHTNYGTNEMEARCTKSSENEETEQIESEKQMGIEEFEETDDARENRAALSLDPSNIESLQEVLSSLNIKKDQDEESCDKTEMIKTELSNNASDDVRVKRESLGNPPPLTRIPVNAIETDRSKKVGQTVTKARGHRTKYDFPQRIAFNGPPDEIYNFSCHLCGELLNTSRSVVNDHFRSKHSQDYILSTLSASLLRMSSEFINGGYKDLLCNRKRKAENNMSTVKRRRRWTPRKYNDGKNGNFSGVGLCVKQVTAKDGEGNFRCKKCDQSCSDMANLREHIAANHRIRGRYLVCLECGDNFVVAPSLQMHLKAFHGIEDPITYMAQNTSYAPEDVDNLEAGGKSIEANQCHVCMAVFEDKAAVDKHLRVHGMAFLNRKRIEAQNAMKSPEKKAEEEEEAEEEKRTTAITSTVEPTRRDNPAETILERIAATI